MTSKTRTNWTYVTTVVIVYAFMLGAAAISFSHIVDVSHTLGLGFEAYTVPFFIDGFAVLGKVGRSKRFSESTRRAGLKLMAAAGVLSLAANVTAGDNLGQQLYGALVVAGFITAEWYAAKLEAAPATAPEVDEETRAKRSEAAKRAAATRKANKAKRVRRPKAPAAAPVSPATVAEIDSITVE